MFKGDIVESLELLFSQYSFESLILLFILLLVCFKFVGELWDYFYAKLRKFFNTTNEKDRCHKELMDNIDELKDGVSNLGVLIGGLDDRLAAVEKDLTHTKERLQENTRNNIIDAHHKYVYQTKVIDDIGLQSIERQYLYYKTAGGNSFIDGLMEEVRHLPKVNMYDANVIDLTLQSDDTKES